MSFPSNVITNKLRVRFFRQKITNASNKLRLRNRPLLICGAGITIILGLAVWVSFRAGIENAQRARPLRVAAYGEYRAPVVSYQASQMDDGFVLLAGDSHAELAKPAPNSCGRPYLNAGLSGAKADVYADFIGSMNLSHRASVAVVTLGTNHLLRKDDPVGSKAADLYERDLSRVVHILKNMADKVIVAAVPPVPAASAHVIDVDGVANLNSRQISVCEQLGCTALDPYVSYESAKSGLARDGASRDGLHLTDYRPAYRLIDAELCR